MTQSEVTFAVGQTRTHLSICCHVCVTPRADGARWPGKVTALDDGDVQVAISAPRGWAGKTVTFSPDLIEHIDWGRDSRPGGLAYGLGYTRLPRI